MPVPPQEEQSIQLDEKDIEILRLLQEDAKLYRARGGRQDPSQSNSNTRSY